MAEHTERACELRAALADLFLPDLVKMQRRIDAGLPVADVDRKWLSDEIKWWSEGRR